MAKKEVNKRPILVTIICILGFIGVLLSILAAIIGMIGMPVIGPFLNITAMPLWYYIFAIILALSYLSALIYVWKMQKIGLIVYTILAVVDYVVDFALGFASIGALIISAIFIGLLYTQFKKMK